MSGAKPDTIDVEDVSPVGPRLMTLEVCGRDRRVIHANEVTLGTAGCGNPNCAARHFVTIAFVATKQGKHLGLYQSLRAQEARQWAADLLAAADLVDGGKGKQ